MSQSESDPHKPVVVLFRHDLRVADNRALAAAAGSGKPVVPVFVLDEESPGTRPVGGARRWWLHHSLAALGKEMKALGADLVLRRGAMGETALALVKETGADMVLWNRRYDPPAMEADKTMKAALRDRGIACESFDGHLLHEPWTIRTGSDTPYRVFTPFWRELSGRDEPRDPVPAPRELRAAKAGIEGDRLEDWNLLPTRPDWAGGLRAEWTPGEAGANERLDAFLDGTHTSYARDRDCPGVEGTSRLSPHLVHGEITPFQVWHAARKKRSSGDGIATFLKEIGWREFCWHLLFHNPDLATVNFNRDFDAFTWHTDARALEAWQRGRTGYPIVDAGMRELWQAGWMHNRVRMIAASFLIKDLMIDWRTGEAWFWDTLVDADPANNPANWQWVAGSGADAAPYFRIFNPELQGAKFDAEGAYVRAFVPEIGKLPDRHVHLPRKAPADVLEKAGIELGKDYPEPVVDHKKARQRALAQHQTVRKGG